MPLETTFGYSYQNLVHNMTSALENWICEYSPPTYNCLYNWICQEDSRSSAAVVEIEVTISRKFKEKLGMGS